MVAKPQIDPRGLKRICVNCGNRFYDLNKRPIVCPSCDTEFTGEIKLKARRGRMAAVSDVPESQVKKKSQIEDEDDEDDIIMDNDTLSLEDLDEGKDDTDDDEDDIDLDLDDDIGDLDDLEPDADDMDDMDDIEDLDEEEDI